MEVKETEIKARLLAELAKRLRKSASCEELAMEIAKIDREELVNLVKDMKFEDAYNKFNGFNLEMNPSHSGEKLMEVNPMFDLNYKSIATTIFKTPNGNCEVYEYVDLWLDDISTPILQGVTP